MKKKILICGASGFIGGNLLRYFADKSEFQVSGTYFKTRPAKDVLNNPRIKLFKVDFTQPKAANQVIKGHDIVIQAAATTSGAKDIVIRPYIHVADNAVMNAHIFRACHDHLVKQVIFFSCTSIYPESKKKPVTEADFDYTLSDKYFGAGWTKIYNEKMCEFYSKIGKTKYMVIRHSNVYGPFDKFDLEHSHVFGATITKVLTAKKDSIVVWGDGSDERDLIYIDDLVSFVEKTIRRQKNSFDIVNVGLGQSISVLDLVKKIIQYSGRRLKIQLDKSKPTIGYKLGVNIGYAKRKYGWQPKVTLDQGIQKTISWYQSQ